MTRRIINTRMGRTMLMLLLAAALGLGLAGLTVVAQPNHTNLIGGTWNCEEVDDHGTCTAWVWVSDSGQQIEWFSSSGS